VAQASWRDARFDQPSGELEPPRVRRVLLRGFAAVIALIAVAVWLVSRDRAIYRCHEDCLGEPALDRYGSLTYEPGHPWTHYADSWQWSAQHGLAQFAALASIIGLALALTSRRNPLPAFALTTVALTGWGFWVLVSPAIP
jgi:hypothetical protein